VSVVSKRGDIQYEEKSLSCAQTESSLCARKVHRPPSFYINPARLLERDRRLSLRL